MDENGDRFSSEEILECGEGATPVEERGTLEAGPRYKRGRGRSFFKSGHKKGLCCQGKRDGGYG